MNNVVPPNTLPPVNPFQPKKTKKGFKLSRRAWLIIGGVIVVGLIGVGIWYAISRNAPPADTGQNNTNQTKKEEPPKPTVLASLTNGVMVSPDIYNRHPVAVMIENSPDARPQVGLTSADIVYETVAEGGITRFMAIFSQNYPVKAGPVRSARSYFMTWLTEYDAFYAHAGGSPTAIAKIAEWHIKDYPHSNDSYWREPRAGVATEHTLFVDVSKIYKFGLEKKKWPATADFKPWLFKDAVVPAPAAQGITINFSSGSYAVKWTFDPATNTYSRLLAGLPHKDRLSGEQITAKTVAAITVQRSPNPPYAGTGKESEWNVATIGEGKAMVFIDGQGIAATWKKPSRTERLRFYDANGAEITLNRGKIWIEAVPQTGSYGLTPAA